MKGTYYWISASVKLEVAKRDKGICRVCGVKAFTASINKRGLLEFKTEDNRTYHYDHIKSVADGGLHTADNLRLTCPNCNLSKLKQRITHDKSIQKILSDFKK